MQKTLAIGHKFEEAKLMRDKADALLEEESKEAKNRMTQDMIMEYNNLIDRQNKEIDGFFEHRHNSELFLNCERNKVILPLENQMKSLQYTLNYGIVPNKKPQKLAFVSTVKSRALRTDKLFPPAEQKSVSSLRTFRKIEDAPKLTVNGLNVKRIIKNKQRGKSHKKIHIKKKGKS